MSDALTTSAWQVWVHSLREPWRHQSGSARVAVGFVVALILTLALRESWAQAVALPAAIFSLVQGYRQRHELADQAGVRLLRPVALALVLYFVLHAIRLTRPQDWHALDGPARFLLLAPLLYLPWLARVHWTALTGYLALSGMIFGITAVVGWFNPVLESRAFGLYTYYNLYGYASSALLGLLIISAPQHRSRPALCLGLVGCLLAVVTSGTRGAWLALPLPILVGLIYLVRTGRPTRNIVRATTVVLVTLALGWPLLQERIDVIRHELSRTTETPGMDAPDLNSSAGYRIAMWTICWAMVQDRPWSGQGLSAFPDQMQPWADRLGLKVSFPDGGFKNPHNQYLGWAAVHGLPLGVVMLALVWLLPGLQAYRIKQQCPSSDNHLAQRSLFLLLGMTAVFCLTESVVERQRGAAWFVIWLGLLLGSTAYRPAPHPTAARV